MNRQMNPFFLSFSFLFFDSHKLWLSLKSLRFFVFAWSIPPSPPDNNNRLYIHIVGKLFGTQVFFFTSSSSSSKLNEAFFNYKKSFNTRKFFFSVEDEEEDWRGET